MRTIVIALHRPHSYIPISRVNFTSKSLRLAADSVRCIESNANSRDAARFRMDHSLPLELELVYMCEEGPASAEPISCGLTCAATCAHLAFIPPGSVHTLAQIQLHRVNQKGTN